MLDAFVDLLAAPALSFGAATVVSRAELLGALLGLWMVGCNMRVDPLAWPLAIASSALYLLVFWQAKLYGDGALQILFIAIAAWGWWQWLRGTQDEGRTPLRVRHLTPRGRAAALAAMALLWPATGFFLDRATDTDVPWWDAFPTAGSVIGQWLLARKYVENWTAWVAVNAVAIALFAYRGLWPTTLRYAVFLALSRVGWRGWHRRAMAPEAAR